MPIPITVIIILLIAGFLIYVGGYLYLIALALAYQAFRHVSNQNQNAGKWRVDTGILMSYLVFFGYFFSWTETRCRQKKNNLRPIRRH